MARGFRYEGNPFLFGAGVSLGSALCFGLIGAICFGISADFQPSIMLGGFVLASSIGTAFAVLPALFCLTMVFRRPSQRPYWFAMVLGYTSALSILAVMYWLLPDLN
ncbi:hypothetical protein [Parvularcula marina]|uniref:Uncharacterized protein n=1 Tax=Parvularcula marina TaxID=2292771 RepID=A0A371RHX6_9PROT|nr:hypothetical protein [Parvularcula marina]RFB05064.1 hypothetical protein DX908_07030 [Parvularcula marina]